MSYYNEDYLAKKIAEETIKQQKEAYNQRLYSGWRIALKLTTILIGFFTIIFTIIFPAFFLSTFPTFLLLLFITIQFCKKHPKE